MMPRDASLAQLWRLFAVDFAGCVVGRFLLGILFVISFAVGNAAQVSLLNF